MADPGTVSAIHHQRSTAHTRSTMALKEMWQRFTGKPEETSADRPLTNQEKFEQSLQRELNDQQKLQSGTHPDQIAHRAEVAGLQQKAGEHAQQLQKPGPAERLVSYKDLFLEPGREAIKETRNIEAEKQQEISDGKRPPFKSYAELHGTEPKSHRH